MLDDMFFNYDNDITCPQNDPYVHKCADNHLTSSSNLMTVFDAKGRPIGICAKYKTPFTLYFSLSGFVEESSIEDLIKQSSVQFTITDYWHKNIIQNTYAGTDVYENDDTIKIELNQADVEKLNQETYHISLILTWLGGQYILYSEDNGFLTIK